MNNMVYKDKSATTRNQMMRITNTETVKRASLLKNELGELFR